MTPTILIRPHSISPLFVVSSSQKVQEVKEGVKGRGNGRGGEKSTN
jgi:hypothetical protein